MDIKTLILALALGNLSLCAALFFFEYESRKSLTMSTWAVAKQLQAAAWLLFAGMALDAAALWEAAGRPVWRRYLVPALVAAELLFVACYGLDITAAPRVALSSLIVAGFFGAGVAALALAWRGASMLRRYLVVTMLALTLVLAARGVLAVALPDGWSWIDADRIRVLALAALYLMMLSNAFGYLLLSRERLQAELTRLEVVDPLTDVPNRRGFYQALTPWMALARRPGLPTAVIILNLDHFKRVNDSYGHPVGDAVLKTMVDVCKKQLRDSDLMGRLGGAEFAVQLPRTSLEDALMVAERIRNAVAALPVKTERAVLNLTASLGVTTIRAEDSTVSLFKRADEVLQQAKREGRDRVVEARAASMLDA